VDNHEEPQADIRQLATRWADDTRRLFILLPAALNELDQLKAEAHKLRPRIAELEHENQELRRSRDELDETLTKLKELILGRTPDAAPKNGAQPKSAAPHTAQPESPAPHAAQSESPAPHAAEPESPSPRAAELESPSPPAAPEHPTPHTKVRLASVFYHPSNQS
jgi:TolA-binding protein